jgi:hypothetical protein
LIDDFSGNGADAKVGFAELSDLKNENRAHDQKQAETGSKENYGFSRHHSRLR